MKRNSISVTLTYKITLSNNAKLRNCKCWFLINAYCKYLQVAYTFDAGPNAFLFLMESDIAEVLALIRHFFPPETDAG